MFLQLQLSINYDLWWVISGSELSLASWRMHSCSERKKGKGEGERESHLLTARLSHSELVFFFFRLCPGGQAQISVSLHAKAQTLKTFQHLLLRTYGRALVSSKWGERMQSCCPAAAATAAIDCILFAEVALSYLIQSDFCISWYRNTYLGTIALFLIN